MGAKKERSGRGKLASIEESDKDGKPAKKRTPSEDDGLPIDRGWAWVVLAGCFLNMTMVGGYNRSLSMLFVEFIAEFKASTAVTTLIMGVKALFMSLFAPITMNILLEFLGTRTTVMIGALVHSAAILGSSFAPNISILIALHCIVGIGHSMIQAPGVVLLSAYFKKRRSLAMTTANASISFSSAIFPILTEFLLKEYGFRGTMLIFSGITLNVAVGASIFIPIESFKTKPKRSLEEEEENEPMVQQNGAAQEYFVHDEECIDVNSDIFIRKQNLDLKGLSRSTGAIHFDNDREISTYRKRRQTFSEGTHHQQKEDKRRSIHNLFASDLDFSTASALEMRENPDREMETVPETLKQSRIKRQLRKILRAFDFSLFKRPLFLLIVCVISVATMQRMTQVYLPARIREVGLTQSDAARILLITGILGFFCRIFYGFFADLKILKVHHIMIIGLLVTGVVTQFLRFFDTFPLLIVFSITSAVFSAAYQCLVPVMITEFLGQKSLAKALGFLALFQGFSIGIANPIVGGIRDVTGSFVEGYHFIGAICFVSAAFLLCEPLVRRLEKRYTDRKQDKKSSGVKA